jgi:hypothetical protein
MNPISASLSLILMTNSIGHTPPSHLQPQDVAQKASHFILHPGDPEQLGKLKGNIRSFMIKNAPINPEYFTIFKSPENSLNPNDICGSTIRINTGKDISLWPVFTHNQYDYWLHFLHDADKLRALYKKNIKAGRAAARQCSYLASHDIQRQSEKYRILLEYLQIHNIELSVLLHAIGQQETGTINTHGQIVGELGTAKDNNNGRGSLQIVSAYRFIDLNKFDRTKYIPRYSFIWTLITHNIRSNMQAAADVFLTKIIEAVGPNPSPEALRNLPLSKVLARYNAGLDSTGYAKKVIYYYNLFYPVFFDEAGYPYSLETFSIPQTTDILKTVFIPPL